MKIFTVTFDQFNTFLPNKSIYFFKKKNLIMIYYNEAKS